MRWAWLGYAGAVVTWAMILAAAGCADYSVCRQKQPGEDHAPGPALDPENTRPATARVLRGGCWYYGSPYGRSAYRGGSTPPSRRNARIGFRVILVGAAPHQSPGAGAAPPTKQLVNRWR